MPAINNKRKHRLLRAAWAQRELRNLASSDFEVTSVSDFDMEIAANPQQDLAGGGFVCPQLYLESQVKTTDHQNRKWPKESLKVAHDCGLLAFAVEQRDATPKACRGPSKATHVYIYIYTHAHIYMNMYTHIHNIHVYMYIYIYRYTYICIPLHMKKGFWPEEQPKGRMKSLASIKKPKRPKLPKMPEQPGSCPWSTLGASIISNFLAPCSFH